MEETDTSIDIAIRCVNAVEVEWMSKACYTGFITKIYKSRSIADPRNPVDRCHGLCVVKEGRSTTGTAPFLHHTRFRTKGSAGSQRHFLGRTSVFGSTDFTYYATQDEDAQGGSAARGQFPEDKRYPVNVRRKLPNVICKDELSSHNNFFSRAADWVALLKPFLSF